MSCWYPPGWAGVQGAALARSCPPGWEAPAVVLAPHLREDRWGATSPAPWPVTSELHVCPC